MQRAFGYFRVSTASQATEKKFSLDVQRERFYAHCEERDYRPVAEYTDVMSGRRDDRTQYQAMLEACRRGEADIVVTLFLDRFGRNTDEILFQTIALRKLGIVVECTNEDVQHPLIWLVQSWKAGEESKRIGERVSGAINRKLREGQFWGSRPPYGWDLAGGYLAVNPEQAEVIRYAVRLLLGENLSARRIAQRLTDEGYRTPKGKPFVRNFVYTMLRRLAITGNATYYRPGSKSNRLHKREPIVVSVPPILDQETAAAVLARFALHYDLPLGRSQASTHLLTGLVYCAYCGHRVAAHTKDVVRKNGTRKSYPSYRCASKAETFDCPARSHAGPALEQAVLDILVEHANDKAIQAARRPIVSSRNFDEEGRLLEVSLENVNVELRKQYALFSRGVIRSEAQLQAINMELEGRRQALDQRLVTLQNDRQAEEHRRRLIALLPQRALSIREAIPLGTPAMLKGMLQEIIERIVVNNENEIEITFRD